MRKTAFIRVQNAKYDDNGNIVGGSASLVESVYVSEGTVPCKQRKLEGLGRIIFLDAERKKGVFLSKIRGIVEYDLESDTFSQVDEGDPRIHGSELVPNHRTYTLFGDVDLMLGYMRKCGILRIFRNMVVRNDPLYEKMICHTLHGILRDNSNICCDRFVERSFLSEVLDIPPSVLRTDSRYFQYLGDEETKIGFFKAFVAHMRSAHPDFGTGCFVDSTPLPNDVDDLKTNRLCSHGLKGASVQTRLILILDKGTGLPVWFELIPGNVLDHSTLMGVVDRVGNILGVTISDLVLDSGYVNSSNIAVYNRDDGDDVDKTMIARMPNRKGYCVDELFDSNRRLFSNAKYSFVRKKHTYFGIRREIELFGHKECAYVYLDDENASNGYREYLIKHQEEYDGMKMKDKNRVRYGGGFFVLVSNIKAEPAEILDMYFDRTAVEVVFKTGKEFLGLLPLGKQNGEMVHGKILQDIIDLIVYLQLRKVTIKTKRSVSDYIYDLQSISAVLTSNGTYSMTDINKQAVEAYRLFGLKPPTHVNIDDYRRSLFLKT